MSSVGPTLDQFSLSTSVSNSLFSKPSLTPLKNLRQLHITPFFPVGDVRETMANIAGSPVERISVRCFEEDVADFCVALEEILLMRSEAGCGFYDELRGIDVAVVASPLDFHTTREEREEGEMALRRLQGLCLDLRISGGIAMFDRFLAEREREQEHGGIGKRGLVVKSRSMSI